MQTRGTVEWLPIGSVVHLKDRAGLLMVIACMVGDETSGMLWDYAAVPYPQGITGPGRDIVFDKAAIDGVFSIGFQNEDGERMQRLLCSAQDEFEQEKHSMRYAS